MSDVEITLGGRVYHMRPHWNAMREIEGKCSSGCMTLLNLLSRGELHASEMALIVYHGLKEAGEEVTDPEAVFKRLFEAGIGTDAVRDPIAEYLMELLWAPDFARKKVGGEWWTQAREITSLMFSLRRTLSGGDPATSGDPLPESSGESSTPSVKNPSA